MVAYSFQAQFIDPIVAGTKRQTIRRVGKRRHAQPGDEIQLYYAMRTKHCRLIGRVRCIDVKDVRLVFPPCRNMGGSRVEMRLGGDWSPIRTRLDHFAQKDGFSDWGELHEFWSLNHPDVKVFEGVLIQWEGFDAH
jgi:hypothetical protein